MSAEAFARLLLYPPAVFLVGCLGLLWLARHEPERPLHERSLHRHIVRWGLVASVALLIALCARVMVQAWSVFGRALTAESLLRIAFESRWGKRWLWQLRAVPIVFAGFWLMGRARIQGAVFAAVGLIWLFVALPLTGHAASDTLLHAAQTLHAGSGALWVGTLALVLCLGGEQRATLLHRFAGLATLSVVGMLLGAALLTWHALPDVRSLWAAPWGRWWSAKATAVVLMLALGARNWRRLRKTESPSDVPTTATTEALVGAVVLVLTAFLTSTGQPGME